MKTFDEQYKKEKNDTEVVPYLLKVSHKGKCFICHSLTNYIDISFECFICSEKCLKELNDGFFEAVNKGKD